MDIPKYYLVSYYARLRGGGFGFGRKYINIPSKKIFNLIEFENQLALESNLKSNDIALISRIEVSVEEYNENVIEEIIL